MSFRLGAAALAACISIALSSEAFPRGEWPDGPNKTWFENLQRPDNHLHPYRQQDQKSLYCCGEADVVRTKFKVESTGGPHPEDTWYAWLKDEWVRFRRRRSSKTSRQLARRFFFSWPTQFNASCRRRAGFKNFERAP